MADLNKSWQSQMHRRLNVIKWVIILLIAAIFARLVYIQIYDTNLSKQSARVHKKLISTQPIYAKNGRILARDGSLLATTVERKRLFFDIQTAYRD